MSLKKTLVLALILIAIVFYIILVELPYQGEIARKELLFKNLPSAEIEAIEITKEGATTLLRNSSPHKVEDSRPEQAIVEGGAAIKAWEMGDVKGSSLDAGSFNALYVALRDLKLDSQIPSEDVDKDLTVYGLSQPSLKIRVKTITGEEEILLGKTNAYLNKRYLKLAKDSAIYLIPETLYSAASKEKDDYRDRTPYEFLDTDVTKTTIVSNEHTIVMELDADKKWQMVQPVQGLASANTLVELNRNLRNLKAKEFINDLTKLSEYKLDNPILSVKLDFSSTINQSAPLEIAFSHVTEGEGEKKVDRYYAYAKGYPSILLLSSDPMTSILKSPDEYREKFLFRFATDKVAKVTSESAVDGKIIAVLADGKWKVNDKEGDKVFVNQWLANFAQLEAKAFPKNSVDFGFDKPILNVTLEIAGGSPTESKVFTRNLVVGKETTLENGEKGYFVATDERKYPFIITSDAFKKISMREESLLPQKKSEGSANPPQESAEEALPEMDHHGHDHGEDGIELPELPDSELNIGEDGMATVDEGH